MLCLGGWEAAQHQEVALRLLYAFPKTDLELFSWTWNAVIARFALVPCVTAVVLARPQNYPCEQVHLAVLVCQQKKAVVCIPLAAEEVTAVGRPRSLSRAMDGERWADSTLCVVQIDGR